MAKSVRILPTLIFLTSWVLIMSKGTSKKSERPKSPRKKAERNSIHDTPLIEPPAIFTETFKNIIPLLITRFELWDLLLVTIIAHFQHGRDTANTVANVCHEASKTLSQTMVKPSIINAMDNPETKTSSITKTKVKLDKFIETFMGRKWEFDYAPHGGVQRNVTRMKDETDQRALLEMAERDFILNEIITDLEKHREFVQKRSKELSEWQNEFEETEILRELCGSAWIQLTEAVAMAKVMGERIPLPQLEPLLKYLQYRWLRATWIKKMNTLHMAAIIHQQTSKTVENTLVESLRSLIKTYLHTTKARNLKIKGLFSQHPTPFDGKHEWTHFSSHHNIIPSGPLDQPLLPRKLRVVNSNHVLTKPAAVAMLALEPLFPYSLKSSRTSRRYVVTHGGYMIKASENEMNDATPRRGFKLSDCNIWMNVPCGGKLSFVIKGFNCCRYGSVLSMATERRTTWKFTGREAEVKAMMAVIQKKMPVLRYQCIQLY